MKIIRLFRNSGLIISLILIVFIVVFQNVSNFLFDIGKKELFESILSLQKENIFLKEKFNEHLIWANSLVESIAIGSDFEGELNHNETKFGKWYYSFSGSREYWEMDEERRDVFDAMGPVNVDLYNSARMQFSAAGKDEVLDIYTKQTKVKLTEIYLLFSRYIKLNKERMTDKENLFARYERIKTMFDIVFSTLIVGVIIFLGVKLIRSIIVGHREFTLRFNQLALGSLNCTIEKISDDEYGTLSLRFNEFVNIMKNVISELKNTFYKLSVDMGEITEITSDFLMNSHTQSASVEEVGSAVSEISAGMNHIAENVESQSRMLESLIEVINKHSKSVDSIKLQIGKVIQQMSMVSAEAVEGERKISQMNESMNKIADSVKHVTDMFKILNSISDQINLLSLNATIEAARAGESGRGFSVVASQISKLADDTSQHLKVISNHVKQNELETENGMKSINEAIIRIKGIMDGVAMVDDMMKEINSVMEKQNEINKKVHSEAEVVKTKDENISIAIKEQKISMDEIDKAVQVVNEVSQKNADGAGIISDNINEIKNLMKQINPKIDYFKL
ncbi:MAG: hypothetical protein JW864_18475 [Spirochaetes bacterium]|nr:hypothetical protein [Spirochaetota bacterium]